jgi:ABC-2 type transport system permease protein
MINTTCKQDIRREIKGLYAFIELNTNLLKRYIAWEVVFFNYAIVNALTIGLIGIAAGSAEKTLYLVIGAVLWSFLSLVFQDLSDKISWERWEGTIEFTLVAPIKRATHLAGCCLSAVLYGIIRTFVLLSIVALVLKINLSSANLPAAMIILGLSSLSFIGLGILGGILPLLSPEKGAQGSHILQAIILLISGVYYDVSILPGWMQVLSKISPATYTLQAMRSALLKEAGLLELKQHIIILSIMGAILIPLGYFCFCIAERYARRHGKLSRNG